MKNKILIILLLLLIIAGFAVYYISSQGYIDGGFGGTVGLRIDNPSVQEYVPGRGNIKGNVDVQEYLSIDKSFEIGADKDGYAVFKDPQKAFEYLKQEYKEGLNLIKKQFNLKELSNENYKDYKIYGTQVKYDISDSQMHEAFFVSKFLDIYENSFD